MFDDARGAARAASVPGGAPRPRAAPFTVEVHATLAGLAALWPRGAEGEAGACHVFQTGPFIESWQRTYGRAARARTVFVAVRETDGTPLLLLPLAIVRRGVARVLTFIDATACDYNAPVLFPTERTWTVETAAQLWSQVTAALPPFDIVMLEKMPAQVGDRVNPLFLLTEADNPESCHGNDLTAPWPEVEARISGLKTLRKKKRAMERIAPVRLEVARTAAARATILAALLAQKQRRFEETLVPGFERHPEKKAFFEEATEAFAAQGNLHLSALYVGDVIVATLWGLLHAGRYYALMIGFEAGPWAHHSPGRVLYLTLMQSLHADGCAVLDLGIGDEPWKLAQADHTVPLRMHVRARTWRGRAYREGTRGLTQLRASKIWRRARPYKWILLRAVRPGTRKTMTKTGRADEAD